MNYQALRKKIGLNQKDFWSAVGITQSGGSRYEKAGVATPQIDVLLDLQYGKDGKTQTIDVAKLIGKAKKKYTEQ